MTLTPLLSAAPAIQLHVICALLALLIGPIALFRRRRDRWHRLAGRTWVVAMLGAAGTALFISEAPMLGPFSLIHIFSVLTFVGVWQGVRAIRRGDVAGHQRAMRGLYAQAMILPGVFTFLPGRRMSLTLFPDAPLAGLALVAVAGAALILAVWRMGPALPGVSGVTSFGSGPSGAR
jgi:uncharacterized membrane protein